VIALRNASAPDVANALQGFITNSLTVFSRAGELSAYEEMLRDIVIVPEPFTNKLLVSATAHYFNQLLRLIEALDEQPPQVVIQVLVAEVDLNVEEEFGVELGLQSPVLFNRSVFPAPAFLTGSSTSLINNAMAGNLVPPGVTVNTTTPGNPVALQGFNFNNASNFALPLGANPAVNPGVVGFQGLSNLGVGRVSPTQGVGGFVFSASSNVFNLLIRALKVQGRMDVLSRPQVMATNNQVATLSVGQNVPIITSTSVSLGTTSTNIERLAVGVNLSVIPRINPDGTVLLHIKPEVSSIISQTVPLGNGLFGTSYNDQTVETTVLAGDGETVAIGGLIQKSDKKSENKVPWLGDLPYLGTLFRFRTQDKTKTELIIILTPHIVRSRADADRILAEEAKRMDWIIGDVIKTQGSSGLAPILPEPPPGRGPLIPGEAPLIVPPGTAVPNVEIIPDPAGQALPVPRKAMPPLTPPIVPPAVVVPMSSSSGRSDPGARGSMNSPAPLATSPAAALPSTAVSLPTTAARSAPGAVDGAAALPTTVILPENTTPPVSAVGTPASSSPGGYAPGATDQATSPQGAPNSSAGTMPAGTDPARATNSSDKEKSRLWKIFHPGQ
jgi:Flp pilus assembly secretin CpaC